MSNNNFTIDSISVRCMECGSELIDNSLESFWYGTNLPVLRVTTCEDCIDVKVDEREQFSASTVYDELYDFLMQLLAIDDHIVRHNILTTLAVEVNNAEDYFRIDFDTLYRATKTK